MYPKTNKALLQEESRKAQNFAAVSRLMCEEASKFPHGAEMVFGPITTGGRGSPELNLYAFEASIKRLLAEGREIFNQIPYEPKLFQLSSIWRESCPANRDAYCWPLLKEVYLPLFQSGFIVRGWFLSGWESSQGARWERQVLTDLTIPCNDLGREWIEDAILMEKLA